MQKNIKKDKVLFLELILTLLINSVVLILSTKIFKGFMISSFGYAILTSLIILILNKTIKPILNIVALPITIMSLGILYPFINVIILKLASLIMGQAFIVEGWFVPFFISIFISISTIFLETIMQKVLKGV